MKTAIVGGRLITPERIIDDGILCLEDGKISGIVRGEVPEGAQHLERSIGKVEYDRCLKQILVGVFLTFRVDAVIHNRGAYCNGIAHLELG